MVGLGAASVQQANSSGSTQQSVQPSQGLPASQCWRLGDGAEPGGTGGLQANSAAAPLREGPSWAALKLHTAGFGLLRGI